MVGVRNLIAKRNYSRTLHSILCVFTDRTEGDKVYVFEADTSMTWQLVKQVYLALAVVGLMMVLQSNLMAQGDVGQVRVEEVVWEAETFVFKSGMEQVVTSDGIIIKLLEGVEISTAVHIKIRKLRVSELPDDAARAMDDIYISSPDGSHKTSATPLFLYEISLDVDSQKVSWEKRFNISFPVSNLTLRQGEYIKAGIFTRHRGDTYPDCPSWSVVGCPSWIVSDSISLASEFSGKSFLQLHSFPIIMGKRLYGVFSILPK